MRIEWLETVMTVVKLGSFSEAADLIPCSQSSVSRQVKCVEDELGITIIKRSSNSNLVELTPAGKLVLPTIKKVLEDYNQLSDLCSRAKGTPPSNTKNFTLGITSWTFSSSSIGNLHSLLYFSHPEILLNVKEVPPALCMEQLTAKKLDAMLIMRPLIAGEAPDPETNDSYLRRVPLGIIGLSMAFGEKFCPNTEEVTFAQLKEENFIFNRDISKLYDPADRTNRHSAFIRACLESGFMPKIITVDRHLADIKLLMAAQGKGIFPSSIPPALRDYPGICFLPVKDAPYQVQYLLLSLADNKNPALEDVTKFLKSCF